MHRFLSAIRFLTVIPVPGARRQYAPVQGLFFYPVVGALIGVCTWGVYGAAELVFPRTLAAVIALVSMTVLTGGLHIDGLADAADGLLSARGPQRAREIMRDSASGAMAIAAVVLVYALKLAAVVHVPHTLMGFALMSVPVAGRCAQLLTIAMTRYARSEGGLAGACTHCSLFVTLLWPGMILAGIGATFVWLGGGYVAGIILPGGCVLGTAAFALYCKSAIGGYTGDTLGAVTELVECACLLCIVALGVAGSVS
jgi:adenosylcobinamide-GDP ribazoletransferase